MRMNRKYFYPVGVSLISLLLAGCETDFSNPVGSTPASSGDADFTTFVTVGDSLTAGFADSALYTSGQENSYPNILAGQFMQAGGGTFMQPLMADNLGGMFAGTTPLAANRLVLDAATSTPEPIAGTGTTDAVDGSLNGMTFNNMGVPGAKSYHLGAPGYGEFAGIGTTANPYYARFSSNPLLGPLDVGAPTVIGDAAAQVPSFFVLWIGNNDILSYATGGGTGVVRDSGGSMADPDYNPANYGSEDITDTTLFSDTYNGLLLALTTASPNAKGVLVNIPDVNAIPYFTTVPFNPVPLDQATADQLMGNPGDMGFTDYNLGLALALAGGAGALGLTQDEVDARQINFTAGLTNAVLIEDDSLTDLTGLVPPLPSIRQATADDLIVLLARAKIGVEQTPGNPATTWGVSLPLEDADVLTATEQVAVESARTAFNATISAAASANPNLVLYDAAAALDELSASGIDYGTGFIDDTYVFGGGFSLDGVHPTARGYAVIANGIIDTINTGFNANVPPVDPGSYTAVFFK